MTELETGRGLVRINRTERAITWQVTVRVGDTAEELRQALEIAREIAMELLAQEVEGTT